MTLTFPDVVTAAKELCNRLKERDSATGALVSQMQSVYNQVEAMKQYQDEVGELNDLASERPRLALVAGIQAENRAISELQTENRELRGALEEAQAGVDLIMSKYREQVSKLSHSRAQDSQLILALDSHTQVLKSNTEEINEMRFIIKSAIEADEASILREEEIIAALARENRGLRELLGISSKYGSLDSHSIRNSYEDKGIQTEPIYIVEKPPLNSESPPHLDPSNYSPSSLINPPNS